jgi:hypothetical protein
VLKCRWKKTVQYLVIRELSLRTEESFTKERQRVVLINITAFKNSRHKKKNKNDNRVFFKNNTNFDQRSATRCAMKRGEFIKQTATKRDAKYI